MRLLINHFLLIITNLFVLKCDAFNTQTLNGYWQLSNKEHNLVNLTGIVPGGIYTDLMRNGVISDVFYGDNDVQSRWVSKTNWIYSKRFPVDSNLLQYENVRLVLNGIDTFSDIYLNGKLIGSTDNMFVSYQYDVKSILKLGLNNITINFASPVKKAQALYDEQLNDYLVPPKCVPNEYNGECHVNHIRKMQASFSWDFAPALPSIGSWNDINLFGYNSSIIENIGFKLIDNGDQWTFVVTTYFMPNNKAVLNGILQITMKTNLETETFLYRINESSNDDAFKVQQNFSLSKTHFDLWWPNELGKQPLYDLTVTFMSQNEEETSKKIQVGIRTIELVEDEIPSGRLFYFKVNNIPFFAKGSNMIPSSILPEVSHNKRKFRFLLQSAKQAHMNMIRVWGGGLYESDYFYALADKLGILIWQDFMFACAMYPTKPEFLKSVSTEVKQQVERLQYHPSIAIYAGNNENEAALRQNWYGTANNFSLYKDDYIKLYVNTIRNIVQKTDNSRQFLVSSPTNGKQSELEGFIAKSPQDNHYGDIHYYNYIFDGWDQNVYQTPRFSSEYGYQSLPSIKSIMSATSSLQDLNIDSDFMKHRQHLPLGFLYMTNLLNQRLKLPDKKGLNYDKAFIFYSQIYQAMAIKIETEHYRQYQSSLNDGFGLTKGALYWQLNDLWIAPTWASIDFKNQWKMLHYYATKFFAPILITSHLKTDRSVDIFVVSDLQVPIFNATYQLRVYNWNSLTAVHQLNSSVDINTGSKQIFSFWLDKYLSQAADCDKTKCFIELSLWHDNNLLSSNILLPTTLKDAQMVPANVMITDVTKIDDKTAIIHLKTNAIAAFVWLESVYEGTFSENGFFLIESDKNVTFSSATNLKYYNIENAFSVTHLLDPQYFK